MSYRFAILVFFTSALLIVFSISVLLIGVNNGHLEFPLGAEGRFILQDRTIKFTNAPRIPDASPWESYYSALGFEVALGKYWMLSVPCWFPIVVAMFFAIVSLRRARWLAGTSRSRFACVHCGYDLRASPERCPECGNVIDQTSSTKPSIRG